MARRQAGRAETKLDARGVRWGVVMAFLEAKWSPRQIASTLQLVFPDDPDMQVPHETLYAAIHAQPRGGLLRQLVACLHHGRGTRMRRTRSQIPGMVGIHVRPPEVEDRIMPGRWEGDFIRGADNKSAVGVLVERRRLNAMAAPMCRSLDFGRMRALTHPASNPTHRFKPDAHGT